MAKAGKYADNIKAINAGMLQLHAHPLVGELPSLELRVGEADQAPQDAGHWLHLTCRKSHSLVRGPHLGVTAVPNIRRRAEPPEWAYVLARARLHVALNHLDPAETDLAWHMAAWIRAEEMISVAGIGRRPSGLPPLPVGLPRGDIKVLRNHFAEGRMPAEVALFSLGSEGAPFWRFEPDVALTDAMRQNHQSMLATGIRKAAKAAIDTAAHAAVAGEGARVRTVLDQARSWFVSEYPLLAALASSFRIIDDEAVCQSMNVAIAAISDLTQEIYFNPKVNLTLDEARFIMGHELLHAGLRHIPRRQGRDPHLWNVACDFVINDWLMEMRVGTPPEQIGYLHDLSLRGMSAEEVYDRIVSDLRWMRKLAKARGMNGGFPDMLEGDRSPAWWQGGGVGLDAYYRRALAEGLNLHLQGGRRGLLPAGLIEEIRSLEQPPIPWDVELGHWLDQFFAPLERRRSYARAHRRQSSTPDIARPAWVTPDEQRAARVFGAVLDTSGSMDRVDLGRAVGAIASYAASREVSFVRLIQCDAYPFDSGYVDPAELLGSIRVHGRGGTVLMPGIRMLESAPNFPSGAPVLILTDGACDHLTVKRPHAFLLTGGRLPFQPSGPVFRVSH